ncbi:trypco2 family protein [Streptomyces sp. FxanaA7]|uniref:trypco2 family protein n=1 Tax=Streptomyces sp. FxanaA7 TaxID=1265492 RepID=UPI000A8D980D|nr:trypco2 family protein [Streptomyces sp. FxanaA7]
MSDRDSAENLVELAQAIESLREQLDTARRLAPEGGLSFEVGPVEMEFQVALLSGSEITGGARFYVLSGGGAKRRERTSTHTVRLTLTPRGPDGGALEVSDSAEELPQR